MRRLAGFVVTPLVLAGLLAAQRSEAPKEVIPSAVSNSIGAVQPRISPDGQTIAVSYDGAIWTVPRVGGVMTRRTHDVGFDIEPVWSPDGEHIAYVNSPRFGAGDLRIITKTGQSVEVPKRIEVLGTIAFQKIEWLPGDRILGVLRVEGQTSGLGWVNWKTGETKTLAPSPQWGRYAASADGQSVAFTTTLDQPGQQTGNDGISADMWRVSINGGEPEKLFRFPSRVHDLCWSADNSGLFVVSELGGGQAHNDIWHVPLRDSLQRMRKRTLGQGDEDRPSVSRDGRWLVFTDNQRGPTSVIARDLADEADRVVKVERFEFARPTGRFKVATTDQGKPTTVRLSVTQVDGKFTAPPGVLYRTLNDVGHFYCEGAAEWSLPAGKYRVRAFHGLEFRPLSREIDIAADQTTDVKLEVERWAELPMRGWHSGENHIHANYGYGQWYNSPATMLTQCAGEGIGVNNFVVANSDTDGIFDREHFRGRIDPISTDQTLLYWNQEFRSTIWGHMTLVNLKQLVEPIMTGFKETTNPWDIPTNGDIADRTHWQGGHVNYTHVAQNPEDPYQNPYTGKGIPVDVALGKIDTLDLNASYAGTVVLWHKLLNCGFRLPASAGTDVFLNRVVSRLPGGDRVYVKIDGPLDYAKWIDGLSAGRSFVTNGPMLEFSVGPHQLGDTIQLDSAKEFAVLAKARSHFPMAKVEVIYNGEVVASVPVSENKQEASWEKPIKLDRSGWLALRASGPGNVDHPVGSLDAHTSPIYVRVAGSPQGSRADAEYFLKWIDRLSLALRLRDRIPNDELRKHVQNQLEAARAVYLKIAESGR
ncbi:MAG: hypothetical protein FD138_10 [Planctomycetota bacterium]|nr:MAG: hypothetical protein FD138_10 [Planctomycetota bacterium]